MVRLASAPPGPLLSHLVSLASIHLPHIFLNPSGSILYLESSGWYCKWAPRASASKCSNRDQSRISILGWNRSWSLFLEGEVRCVFLCPPPPPPPQIPLQYSNTGDSVLVACGSAQVGLSRQVHSMTIFVKLMRPPPPPPLPQRDEV